MSVGKCARSKDKRSGEVLGEVAWVVAAGIDVEFMRDAASGEHFVQRGGAGIEAEIVLITTVKIDFQACQAGSAGDDDGAIAIPECRVRRTAENTAQDARAGGMGR